MLAVTSTGGGAESIIPPGLTDGVNCISLFPGTTETGQFFAKYKGNLTGTSSAIRTSINTVNTTNWDIGTVDSGILPSNYTPNITCASLPTVASTATSNIKSVSATLGGNVTADGGDSVVRGIVWATTANPVVTTNTTVPNGTGTGTYSATITGLPVATTIHFRAYATNSAGTSYGNDLTFTTGASINCACYS
ncbi:hypothetical protein ACQ9BO_24150 [Flavobacterium sp. P21]|uniref:hypothetical protein n=1 Tax=Flavobacterium sp. P21 TaxID=3423948 RepID=UPI003D676E5E